MLSIYKFYLLAYPLFAHAKPISVPRAITSVNRNGQVPVPACDQAITFSASLSPASGTATSSPAITSSTSTNTVSSTISLTSALTSTTLSSYTTILLNSSSSLSSVSSITATQTSANQAVAGYIPVAWAGSVWKGAVTVGTTSMNLIVDTGSSQFWVMSTSNPNCSASAGCYDPAGKVPVSTSIADMSWAADYVSSSNDASGDFIVYDSISTTGGLYIPNQLVECSNAGPISGVGFIPLSRSCLIKKKYFEQPWATGNFNYFTTYLKATNAQITPRVTFGQDPGFHGPLGQAVTAASGSCLWHVNVDTTWTAEVSLTGSTATSFALPVPSTGILLDTGTTDTELDVATVIEIYTALNGSCAGNGTGCSYPCTRSGTTLLPANGGTVSLPFGNSVIDIDMSQLVNGYQCEGNNCTCDGTIRASKTGSFVYGSLIYKSAFFKWDVDADTISVATYD